MMNIYEYFDNILETTDNFDVYCDAQDELNTLLDDDDFDLEGWAAERNIDLDAVKTFPNGETIKVFTLWQWDMED